MRKKRSNGGFTLIEMMIASSILAIAVIGATAQYMEQIKSQGASNMQMAARGVLTQAISKIKASPADFPAIFDSSSNPLTYIACYNDKGSVVPNYNGVSNFVGKVIAQPRVADPAFCPNARMQVYVTRPNVAVVNQVAVDLFILAIPGEARVYNLNRSEFNSTVIFDQSL